MIINDIYAKKINTYAIIHFYTYITHNYDFNLEYKIWNLKNVIFNIELFKTFN